MHTRKAPYNNQTLPLNQLLTPSKNTSRVSSRSPLDIEGNSILNKQKVFSENGKAYRAPTQMDDIACWGDAP